MRTPFWLREDGDGARVAVRLVPRAARDEIAGTRGGSLLVRVCAPAAEDRANQALVSLLAKRLGIGRGRVEVVSGRRSREKVVRVRGLDASEVAARLG